MKLTRLRAAIAALLAVLTTTVAIYVRADGGPNVRIKIVFGQKLAPKGQHNYQVEKKRGHRDLGANEIEAPAAVAARNQRTAEQQTKGPDQPVPLAAKEPVTVTNLLPRNYSSRHGARPALLVVHDTESWNVAGLQDVLAIRAWFSNPAAQASSNYTTDAEGNTIALVPETAKAWTQAYFNPWAISDELIGHANQSAWPDEQLRAAARIFAAASARWGIPVQLGAVRGCTIVRAGIVDHKMLGACGGGHHDNGPAFPMAHFIRLVADYRAGGFHPKPAAKRNPDLCSPRALQLALNRHGARVDVDGVKGPLTIAALKRFQRANHLQVTGRVGPAGARALGCAPAARPAAAGQIAAAPVFDKKSLWYEDIAATGGVRWDKLRTVTGGPLEAVYFDPRDQRMSRAVRDDGTSRGFAVGLYSDPHWYPAGCCWVDQNGRPLIDPIAYRKQLDADVNRLLAGAHDPVMLDLEKVQPQWFRIFLWGRPGEIGYRGRNGEHSGGTRPTRDTAYTNEPFQDGTVVPIQDLIDAQLPWFVQLYYGDMRPAEAWWALKQLVQWGYPVDALRPFYDARNYPADWHPQSGGALFTSNRLQELFQ
jgi:N-acetyl-anhydromuramyl-L-alanine amidase AmpD